MEFIWSNNTLADFIMREQTVHLWKSPLNSSPQTLDYLFSLLSPDEITRAERFYQSKHRHEFILARGLLRIILGRYLGTNPNSIIFSYSSRGKPVLADFAHPLQFNLSHSAGLVIYAISSFKQVGIDLEHQKKIDSVEDLAKRFFSPQEYQYLIKQSDKSPIFFKLWTAKEAYLKATGEGIAGGLDKIIINIKEDGNLCIGEPWSLFSFSPETEYYGALVVSNSQEEIEISAFSLSDDVDRFYLEQDRNH